MFFIPILDNKKDATFTVSAPAAGSPASDFLRLGWTRTGPATYKSPIGVIVDFNKNYDAARDYITDRGLYQRRTIRVTYRITKTGRIGSFGTWINGTDRSIASYYQGMPITVGQEEDPAAVAVAVECPINPSRAGYRAIDQRRRSVAVPVLPFVDGTTAAPWVVYRDDYDRATIEDNERPRAGWLSRVPDQYLVSLSEAVAKWGYTLAKPAGAVGLPLLKFAALIQQRAGETGPRDRDLKLAADIRAAVLHNYESSRRNLAARKWGRDDD